MCPVRSRITLVFGFLAALTGPAIAQNVAQDSGITPLHHDLAARNYQSACMACHYRGAGKASFDDENPALKRSPDELVQVILFGKAPEEGRGGMPAFGAGLTDADVTRLAVWLRETAKPGAPWTDVAASVARMRASGQRGE
jgi:mono/diheme cytochrome c family protein